MDFGCQPPFVLQTRSSINFIGFSWCFLVLGMLLDGLTMGFVCNDGLLLLYKKYFVRFAL